MEDKLHNEVFRPERIDYDIKYPEDRWEDLLTDLRYLGIVIYPRLKEGKELGEWNLDLLNRYFAKIVDALRSVHFPIIPPTNEDNLNLPYWRCYEASKKYMETEPPNEEDIKEWDKKREETIKIDKQVTNIIVSLEEDKKTIASTFERAPYFGLIESLEITDYYKNPYLFKRTEVSEKLIKYLNNLNPDRFVAGSFTEDSSKLLDEKSINYTSTEGSISKYLENIKEESKDKLYYVFSDDTSIEELSPGKFTVQRHWYGKAIHFDISLKEDTSFDKWALTSNPCEAGSTPILVVKHHICKEPRWFNFSGAIPPKGAPDWLAGGNPTKNKMAYVKVIDKGTFEYIANTSSLKNIEFKGNRLRGTYVFVKGKEKWFFRKYTKKKEEKKDNKGEVITNKIEGKDE